MVQWCAQSGCKSLATHDVKMYAPQRWSACKLRVFQQLTQARWCRWHATVEAYGCGMQHRKEELMAGVTFDITGIQAVQQRLQQMAAEVLPLMGIALHQEAEAILEAESAISSS